MSGTHLTGPIKSEGKISSGAGFNIVPFSVVGSTASTITVAGVAAGDIILGAFRLRGWAGVPVVSNLTSVAVASANTITFTASPGVASGLVFGAYVDVSAAT